MFRRPRDTEPDKPAAKLGTILQPLTVFPWGPHALGYLGVPIVAGASMIAVQDKDYPVAIQKLQNAGFIPTVPNRAPAPEVMEDHPNPQQMLEEINAGYKRLDRSCAVFEYPHGSLEKETQVYLLPNSFTHLPLDSAAGSSNDISPTARRERYHVYGNLHYPLEAAMVESVVKATIDEEDEAGYSAWGELLRSWVSLMTGYLEVNNDILDHCEDMRAVEWYSANFGRVREAKFGPLDRQITKRLGSGKEMPVDMRGNRV